MKHLMIAALMSVFISAPAYALEYLDPTKTEFTGYFGCFSDKEEGTEWSTKSIRKNCSNYDMNYKLIPEKSYLGICKDGFDFIITYTCVRWAE